MSRRTDKFKKILPTDIPNTGAIPFSTSGVSTGRVDCTKPNLSNLPKPAPTESDTVKKVVKGAELPCTDVRYRLDFTIRLPKIQNADPLGPGFMDFIVAGLQGTLLDKGGRFHNQIIDLLPGSRMNATIKQHKLPKKRAK